jgi:hypothetical protein
MTSHAVVYVMNLLSPAVYKRTAHATSCRVMSAYKLATGQKLDLMDTIAAPGELEVADYPGAKAYSCDNTCEILWLRLLRKPHEGGCLLWSFEIKGWVRA